MVIEVKITGGTMLVDDDIWFRFIMVIGGSLAIDGRGYAYCMHQRKNLRFHRWVMDFPSGDVGHLDANKLNNTLTNLYVCTRSENFKNLNDGIRCDNTSGYTGVAYNKRDRKWRARINSSGTEVFCASFDTREEAIAARKKAEKQYGYYATR